MASIPILFVFSKAEAMGFVYNARVFQDDVGPLSEENFAFTIVCRHKVVPIRSCATMLANGNKFTLRPVGGGGTAASEITIDV